MFNLTMLLSCFISYLIFSDKRVFYLNLNITRLVRNDIRNWVTLVCTLIYGKRMHYSPTSSNGHLHNVHLSTAATFLADSPYIDSCFNLSTTSASLQWKLSSVPKVAVLERFKIIWRWRRLIKVVRGDYVDIGSEAMQRLSDCKNYTRNQMNKQIS